MRDALVIAQMATMVALAVLFARDNLPHLAVAQVCYVIATFALFMAGARA